MSAESSTPGKQLSPQTSLIYGSTNGQINEDTVEPSLAAQDINPITYAPDLIFAPRAGFVPGAVQLIRPVHILSLTVAHSTARPNRQVSGMSHWQKNSILMLIRIQDFFTTGTRTGAIVSILHKNP